MLAPIHAHTNNRITAKYCDRRHTENPDDRDSRDEAWGIAAKIVKLPELLSARPAWKVRYFNGDDDGHMDWDYSSRRRLEQRPSILDVS